jgi:hypothetical protein
MSTDRESGRGNKRAMFVGARLFPHNSLIIGITFFNSMLFETRTRSDVRTAV